MGFAGGWFGTSPRRSRVLIDGASVEEGLRRATNPWFEAEFHRYIGQLRRLPPRLQKTLWRRFFIHKWRACEDDDYVHANRNDEDYTINPSQ